MKRVLSLLCVFMLITFMTGCTDEVINVTVSRYPDRIVYIAGIDTTLDLTGGELTFTLRSFRGREYTREGEPMAREIYRISHDIDFTVPGVYIVSIDGNRQINTFAIQVVDVDFINNALNR